MADDRTHARQALGRLLDALDGRRTERVRLMADRPVEGPLFAEFAHHALADVEVALVLAALAARLAGEPALSGQELAAAVADDSAGRLAALARLDGEAPVVRAGMLVAEVVPEHAADAHDTRFRLGDAMFRLACEVYGRPAPPPAPRDTGPFRGNAEVLGELRRLSLHYRRRAARVFHLDPWTGTGIEVVDGASVLVRRAEEEAARVAGRLRATRRDTELPALAFQREHGLGTDELVILATVLFQELIEGVGAVDAVDLVKLVSASEAELLEKRQILRPLARAGLLRLEGAYAGKDLTADASLPPEIVAALLGQQKPIDSDQRLDFHSYLQQLESSDPFFDDLDGSSFGS